MTGAGADYDGDWTGVKGEEPPSLQRKSRQAKGAVFLGILWLVCASNSFIIILLATGCAESCLCYCRGYRSGGSRDHFPILQVLYEYTGSG